MAFIMPGPLEITIIFLILVMLGLWGLIVIVRLVTGKLSSSKPQSPPCPSCGGWTFPGTRFCPHCGSPINPPDNPGQPPGQ